MEMCDDATPPSPLFLLLIISLVFFSLSLSLLPLLLAHFVLSNLYFHCLCHAFSQTLNFRFHSSFVPCIGAFGLSRIYRSLGRLEEELFLPLFTSTLRRLSVQAQGAG